MQARGYLDNR